MREQEAVGRGGAVAVAVVVVVEGLRVAAAV